ncbi:hypothetical protein F2Q68_00013601 [Brassica cretica]|uniref:Uncharacterized protein n=1 Tax=Brassica cretica TaxID=69181 RepID=A0A8S9HC46_BRACR|nr:hypothetical protein F2Q68_00013601 [Brassica cretica]
MMAASVDPLVVGRVIGDVLDMYIPTANMSVYVGPKHITNGCEIKPSVAVNPPKVNISGNSDELYTLVMTDPDAPSPSERTCENGSIGLSWISPEAPIHQKQPPSRANFSTRMFAGHLDLGLPVATVYFNAQKEPASRRR